MKVIGMLEYILFNQMKCNVQKKFSQTTLTLLTFLLWISPGLGDDKPPDCTAQDFEFCTSPCTYLRDRCSGNRECSLGLCSAQLPSRDLVRCWDLLSDCTDEYKSATKRGILNKNVAYLLLKLHPFLNQTSQFGFLTSGRFRRITGNFGTEFLGKRSNNKYAGSRGGGQTPVKPKPTPQFYSLPLNKLAKTKVLKRGYDDVPPQEFLEPPEKRLSIRGNGRVILGSEFLGKRGQEQQQQPGRIRRLTGTEFLGKRNDDMFDGSEFLGKRLADSSGLPTGKRQHEPLSGTELLGKKSQDSSREVKRFGNELLGKRVADGELQEGRSLVSQNSKNRGFGFLSDYDPELVDEAFSSYETVPRFQFGSHFCQENESGICGKLKVQ